MYRLTLHSLKNSIRGRGKIDLKMPINCKYRGLETHSEDRRNEKTQIQAFSIPKNVGIMWSKMHPSKWIGRQKRTEKIIAVSTLHEKIINMKWITVQTHML